MGQGSLSFKLDHDTNAHGMVFFSERASLGTCGGSLGLARGLLGRHKTGVAKVAPTKSRYRRATAARIWLAAAALVGLSPAALAEPAPRSLDRALTDVLALGLANGCSTAFGIPDFAGNQQDLDTFLAGLRDSGQLGKEVTAVCGSSAVASAAALGGSLGSLQTTKTVSQFRLARRRLDSRLDLQGKRSGLDGTLMFAALSEPVRPPMTDALGLEPAPQSGIGVFTHLEYERRDRELSELEAGYKSDISGGLIGIDYLAPAGFVVGAWAGYRNTDADYRDVNLLAGSAELSRSLDPGLLTDICNVGPGGGFDDKGTRFGGFFGGRFGRGFADLTAQYSRRDYDYKRNICAIETPSATDPIVRDANSPSGFSSGGVPIDDIYAGTISGETKLTEWSVSARAGYDFGNDRLLWGPRISITYLKSRLGSFTEAGRTSVTNQVESNNPAILTTTRAAGDPTGLELAFDKQSRASLQSETQLVAAYRFEPQFGAVIPRVSVSWIHEFKGERDLVKIRMAQDFRAAPTRFSFTTDSADKNKGVVTIGLTALIGAQFSADIEVSRLVGDDRFDSTAATAQARWRF